MSTTTTARVDDDARPDAHLKRAIGAALAAGDFPGEIQNWMLDVLHELASEHGWVLMGDDRWVMRHIHVEPTPDAEGSRGEHASRSA